MAEQIQQENKGKPETVSLVRILSTDIKGDKNVCSGLTKIKGISFSISNAVCKIIGLDKYKKVGDLTQEEIKKIGDIVKEANFPKFLVNRRFNLENGEDRHLTTAELDLTKEFDIKRLRKIKSYRGLRLVSGLPVRGQRTKSHFRKKGRNKVVGVKKKK